MDERKRLLIQMRLDKCHEDIQFARLLLAEGGYRPRPSIEPITQLSPWRRPPC